MIRESSSKPALRCPVCGRGFLRPGTIVEAYDFDDRGTIVHVEAKDVPVENCDACGESFRGPEAARLGHDALGRALGLLFPAEIIAIRENAGWSVSEFAARIGSDPETLMRWEKGVLWQDRITDNLIRLLNADRDNLERLSSRNFEPATPSPASREDRAGEPVQIGPSSGRAGRFVELD